MFTQMTDYKSFTLLKWHNKSPWFCNDRVGTYNRFIFDSINLHLRFYNVVFLRTIFRITCITLVLGTYYLKLRLDIFNILMKSNWYLWSEMNRLAVLWIFWYSYHIYNTFSLHFMQSNEPRKGATSDFNLFFLIIVVIFDDVLAPGCLLT